jgi:hypothetical protein
MCYRFMCNDAWGRSVTSKKHSNHEPQGTKKSRAGKQAVRLSGKLSGRNRLKSEIRDQKSENQREHVTRFLGFWLAGPTATANDNRPAARPDKRRRTGEKRRGERTHKFVTLQVEIGQSG